MSVPYMSEIRIFSFNFPPKGWAACNGQLMPINQNQPLFALLGTTFGGNGQTNFALPDMRGCVPVHNGSGFTMGQKGGEQAHTLVNSEMPTHAHFLNGTTNAVTTTNAQGNAFASITASNTNVYRDASAGLAAMSPQSVTSVGGSQAHQNMQPYLTLNFCIALVGVFPSRN